MLYRTMGRTGVDVSILGFGCMRLPIIGGDQTKIDYELATEMLHYAIESGVNYVDTAWFYHGTGFTGPGGESEHISLAEIALGPPPTFPPEPREREEEGHLPAGRGRDG